MRDKRNYFAELEDVTVVESAEPDKHIKHSGHAMTYLMSCALVGQCFEFMEKIAVRAGTLSSALAQ